MDFKLRILSGAKAGQELPIRVAKFFIGRAEDCHLRPHSDLISRHHCALIMQEMGATVRDFGSKNGTFVNDERVRGEQELKSGDTLKVGPLHFEVVLQAQVGGPKLPAVRNVQEAVSRLASQSSANKEGTLDDWLGNAAPPKGETTFAGLPDEPIPSETLHGLEAQFKSAETVALSSSAGETVAISKDDLAALLPPLSEVSSSEIPSGSGGSLSGLISASDLPLPPAASGLDESWMPPSVLPTISVADTTPLSSLLSSGAPPMGDVPFGVSGGFPQTPFSPGMQGYPNLPQQAYGGSPFAAMPMQGQPQGNPTPGQMPAAGGWPGYTVGPDGMPRADFPGQFGYPPYYQGFGGPQMPPLPYGQQFGPQGAQQPQQGQPPYGYGNFPPQAVPGGHYPGMQSPGMQNPGMPAPYGGQQAYPLPPQGYGPQPGYAPPQGYGQPNYGQPTMPMGPGPATASNMPVASVPPVVSVSVESSVRSAATAPPASVASTAPIVAAPPKSPAVESTHTAAPSPPAPVKVNKFVPEAAPKAEEKAETAPAKPNFQKAAADNSTSAAADTLKKFFSRR